MIAVKKINNNVALCVDCKGNELIALGKGIGYHKMPYTIKDLSVIRRTFYSVKPEHLDVFNGIDEEIFEDVARMIQYFREHLKHNISDSLFYVLVDHIDFAIKRARAGVYFKFNLASEIKYSLDDEYEVGEWAVNYLNRKHKVHLLKDEASIIAIHITENYDDKNYDEMIDRQQRVVNDITEIIERIFNMKIDRTQFNYSRFTSHLDYLMKRFSNNMEIKSDNKVLYDSMAQEFPDTSRCAEEINEYFKNTLGGEISKEEQLYLMLHINRLVSRETAN